MLVLLIKIILMYDYANQMDSDGMTLIPGSIKIGPGLQRYLVVKGET
jgi:hypothetical protein